MYIRNISLKNYRNIKFTEIELKNGVNIFYGNNAQGKTNFLESIYMCATGRSHRTHIDKELINFEQLNAYIRAEIQLEDKIDKIDIHLKKDSKKGIAINKIPIKKLGQLFGTITVVIFSPEDLNLVKAGPAERRKFIDIELCQINKIYYYNLGQYYKILKQRNALLKKISKDISFKETIFVWDKQLLKYGKKIIEIRKDFINNLNNISKKIHFEITGDKEELEIKYKPNVEFEEFEERLIKNLDKDILYCSTLYGPHKDDMLFFINNINVKDYGSQGQQRTVSLTTKLAEIKLIKQEKDILPILLLDDVLSELDKSRQRYLISHIKNIQVIITCTGIEDVIKNLEDDYKLFKVKDGNIFLE